MKHFLSQISPTGAFRDLLTVWRTPGQNRWLVLAAAMAMTFCMAMLFIPESKRIEPRPPEILYISTFAADRTEREIIASNCRNQELKDALEARLAEREEFRRDIYRALGRVTFIDVDAIEAEVEADRAREAAAAAAAEADREPALSLEEYCARALG